VSKVSNSLRKGEDQGGRVFHSHWCPGCGEMHVIFANWTFDGNVTSPTFSPSVLITGKETVKVNGKWTGEWVLDVKGNAVESRCHYFLKEGKLEYLSDCTHKLAGQTIPLPPLPEWLSDDDI
jgi:hypothetical protein